MKRIACILFCLAFILFSAVAVSDGDSYFDKANNMKEYTLSVLNEARSQVKSGISYHEAQRLYYYLRMYWDAIGMQTVETAIDMETKYNIDIYDRVNVICPGALEKGLELDEHYYNVLNGKETEEDFIAFISERVLAETKSPFSD